MYCMSRVCIMASVMVLMTSILRLVLKADLTDTVAQDFSDYFLDRINAVASEYPDFVFRLTGVPAYMKVRTRVDSHRLRAVI